MSTETAREAITNIRRDLRKIGAALEEVGADRTLPDKARRRLASLADENVAGLSMSLKRWAAGLDESTREQ